MKLASIFLLTAMMVLGFATGAWSDASEEYNCESDKFFREEVYAETSFADSIPDSFKVFTENENAKWRWVEDEIGGHAIVGTEEPGETNEVLMIDSIDAFGFETQNYQEELVSITLSFSLVTPPEHYGRSFAVELCRYSEISSDHPQGEIIYYSGRNATELPTEEKVDLELLDILDGLNFSWEPFHIVFRFYGENETFELDKVKIAGTVEWYEYSNCGDDYDYAGHDDNSNACGAGAATTSLAVLMILIGSAAMLIGSRKPRSRRPSS